MPKVNNKNRSKKIIKQKLNNKTELEKLKVQLRNTINEINNKMSKARIHEKLLRQEIKIEKINFKNSEKVKNEKTRQNFINNKELILENKKLISEQKKNLKIEINLLKQENKNKLLDANKSFFFELEDLKDKLKIERINQKNKIINVKNKIFENKIKLKKDLKKEQSKNNEAIFSAKSIIKKKQQELIEKQQNFNYKKTQFKLKNNAARSLRIYEAKLEKEKIKKKKQEEKKKIKDKIIDFKMGKIDGITSELNDIKVLKNDLEKSKKEEAIIRSKHALSVDAIKKETNKELKAGIAKLNSETNNEFKKDKQFNDDYQVNLKNPIEIYKDSGQEAYGKAISQVGLKGLKLYKKHNKGDSKLKIDNLKIQTNKIYLIKEFQKSKKSKTIIDIREFEKYVSFIVDKKQNRENFNSFIISIVVNILRGQVFQFLNGYFQIEKDEGCKWIKYSKELKVSSFNVISFIDNYYIKEFENILEEKLNLGAMIKINNNIAIKKVDKQIVVLHDLGFLR